MDKTSISIEFSMGHKDLRPEPLKLLVADDVKECLVKGGYWNFLSLFDGFDVELTNQMVNSWDDGNVNVFGYDFTIDTRLLAEITGLPNDGDRIRRGKQSLVSEMGRFFTGDEKPGWENKAVLRESLPQPWPRVAGTIMNYFTLDVEMKWVRGYHFVFLSNLRWGRKVNVPKFLFCELDRAVEQVRIGNMKFALHQGLFLLIFKFIQQKKGWKLKVEEIPSKGKCFEARNEDHPPNDQERPVQKNKPYVDLSEGSEESSVKEGDTSQCEEPHKEETVRGVKKRDKEEAGLNMSGQKMKALKRSVAALKNLLDSSERFENLRAQAMEEARIQFKDVETRLKEIMDEE